MSIRMNTFFSVSYMILIFFAQAGKGAEIVANPIQNQQAPQSML